jgi:hypothetical protein
LSLKEEITTMKFRAFFLISCIAANVSAQLTLTQTNNEPKDGDVYNIRSYDSTSVLSHNQGQNQVWNYSSIIKRVIGPGYFIEYHTPLSTSTTQPGPVTLQTGDKFNSFDYSEFYRSSTSPQQLEFLGSIYGSPSNVSYTNTLIKFKWPISFGTGFTDGFGGTWAQSQNSNGHISGSYTLTGTGTGTLILPGGVEFSNILQVTIQRIDTITNWTFNGQTEIVIEKTFDYYHAAEKFPVLGVTYLTVRRNGTWFPPSLELRVLDVYAVDIREHPVFEPAKIFPNPAKERIDIDESGKVEIFDMQGQKVLEHQYMAHDELSIASLKMGVYLVKVSTAKRTYLQRLVVD